jgi:predicted ATPase
MATSREPLGLDAETVFPVPPMGIPPQDAVSGETLRAFDGTRLFLARAERAVPGLAVSPSDARAVARLCARLDGLPLAIELAASRLKVLSVAEIDERLADRFRLLRRAGTAHMPERQRTLRAAIGWSYELLDEPERRLFRRLSVFAVGFGPDAVEAVCAGDGLDEEEVLDLIAGLVDKSLVVRGEQAGRAQHRLLDSVRDFAAERCAQHDDPDRLRARHFGHFLALATRADEELRGPGQAEWLARLRAAEDDLRAAVRWGLSAGDPASALDLVWLLHQYWWWVGHFSETRKWFEEAMARTAGAPPSVNRARALTRWAETVEYLGDYATARSLYEQALAVARAIDDPVRIGSALIGLGSIAMTKGDLAHAPARRGQPGLLQEGRRPGAGALVAGGDRPRRARRGRPRAGGQATGAEPGGGARPGQRRRRRGGERVPGAGRARQGRPGRRALAVRGGSRAGTAAAGALDGG